jgi:hypothetical protein
VKYVLIYGVQIEKLIRVPTFLSHRYQQTARCVHFVCWEGEKEKIPDIDDDGERREKEEEEE